MIENPIRNRGPKRRDPACLQTVHAILIPAGTILRQDSGKAGVFTCPLAGGVFTIEDAAVDAGDFKRVVA